MVYYLSLADYKNVGLDPVGAPHAYEKQEVGKRTMDITIALNWAPQQQLLVSAQVSVTTQQRITDAGV